MSAPRAEEDVTYIKVSLNNTLGMGYLVYKRGPQSPVLGNVWRVPVFAWVGGHLTPTNRTAGWYARPWGWPEGRGGFRTRRAAAAYLLWEDGR